MSKSNQGVLGWGFEPEKACSVALPNWKPNLVEDFLHICHEEIAMEA